MDNRKCRMLRKNGMYFLLTLKFVHAKIKLVHGALAQLGERYTGSVEVSGSIPLCSTIRNLKNGRDAVFLI